jgi:hypothetical protein
MIQATKKSNCFAGDNIPEPIPAVLVVDERVVIPVLLLPPSPSPLI